MGYLPIRPYTLKANKTFTFDLFVSVGPKYLLYVRRGDDLEATRLERLGKMQDKTPDRFFIEESSFSSYEQFISEELQKIISDPQVPVEEKVEAAEETSMMAMENMEKNPESRASFKMTEKAASSLKDVILQNPQALKKIFGAKAKDANIIMKHCFNVCALATEFAASLGFKGSDLDDLGTAALIHDLGISHYKDDERALFNKRPNLFTPEDKRIYKFHPKDTVDKLKGKPYINDNILSLILHHEEKISGQGLNGIKKLSQLEQILSLVNLYEKKVSSFGTGYFDAMKEVFEMEVGNYELKLIKGFKEFVEAKGLFNLPEEEDTEE